jgi:hypothetical protein
MTTKSENAPAKNSTYKEDKTRTASHCRHHENITFVFLSLSELKLLTSHRWTGHCPIKCTPFSSEGDNTVLQWAFKLNSALASSKNVAFKSLYAEV